MAHVATMGTFSCATIAIGGFKKPPVGYTNAYEANDAYLCKEFTDKNEGMTVDQFYKEVLYPVSQPLGKSKDYPFDMLMDLIEGSAMKDKFMIATLNEMQYNWMDNYWPKRLAARGFTLIDKTQNNIGSLNYIYTRNLARVE